MGLRGMTSFWGQPIDEFLVRTKPLIRSSRHRERAGHVPQHPPVEWEHHIVVPFLAIRKSEVCSFLHEKTNLRNCYTRSGRIGGH